MQLPITFHKTSAAVPNFALEHTVLDCWQKYSQADPSLQLEDLRFSDAMGKDFRDLVTQLEKANVPSGQITEAGKETLQALMLRVRGLQADTASNTNYHSTLEKFEKDLLTPSEWKTIFNKIIQRISTETSYFADAATSGALNVTQNGLFSKQLTSMIIPVKSEILQKIITQPVFFPDIGVIIHPGSIPSAKELSLALAKDGKLPASFANLQESISEILSWPKKERIKSFCISAACGLITIPFSITIKALLFIPRILGVGWFKKATLSLRVDPALEQTFAALCSNGYHTPSLTPHSHYKGLVEKVLKEEPKASKEKVAIAAKNLLELQALGYSINEIGVLIHGAKFDKQKQVFAKLEKAILTRCHQLKIRTLAARDRLLDLDDAVWRLSFTESRLQAMQIAREELDIATKDPQRT